MVNGTRPLLKFVQLILDAYQSVILQCMTLVAKTKNLESNSVRFASLRWKKKSITVVLMSSVARNVIFSSIISLFKHQISRVKNKKVL